MSRPTDVQDASPTPVDGTGRKTLRRRWIIGTILLTIASFLTWAYLPVGANITVSRETTYLLGPLNPDGTVNYLQAFADQHRQDVAPGENGAVLWVCALGPEVFHDYLRQQSLEQLGLSETDLLADAPHFILFHEYQALNPPADPDDTLDPNTFIGIPEDPSVDSPTIRGWLAANEHPLGLLAQAVDRPHFARPIVFDEGETTLRGLFPSHALHRGVEAITALVARAIYHAREGRFDDARTDLRTALRLTEREMDYGLAGWMINLGWRAVMIDAYRQTLFPAELPADQWRRILKDLRDVGPLPSADEIFELERLWALSVLTHYWRTGVDPLTGESPTKRVDLWQFRRLSLDWDELFKAVNTSYDESISLAQSATHREFQDRLGKLAASGAAGPSSSPGPLDRLTPELPAGIYEYCGRIFRATNTRRNREDIIGSLTILVPELIEHHCRYSASWRVLLATCAAKLHKAEHGTYPETIDELAVYLGGVPIDPFDGQPLRYVVDDLGPRIYSIGPNLTDDNGLSEWELWCEGVPELDDTDDDVVIHLDRPRP